MDGLGAGAPTGGVGKRGFSCERVVVAISGMALLRRVRGRRRKEENRMLVGGGMVELERLRREGCLSRMEVSQIGLSGGKAVVEGF